MITKLTKAQEERLQEFRLKWTSIGLCTERADRVESERGIKMAYATAELSVPRIVWCGSPISQALTRAIVFSRDKSVGASVGDSVGDSVRASVRASVGDSGYGQHDANWIGFYAFFREACGLVKETDKLQGLDLITRNAGWFLPHKNICWVSERTSKLAQDNRFRLHCENGPAVSYPDGWEIYAWHGVRVPKRVITDDLAWKDVQTEQNQEVRQVMIQRFGAERLLREAGAKEDHRDDFGTLYSIPSADRKVVKVVNSTPEADGTFKDYFLFVPPDVQRAKQAVAWTFGQTEGDYNPAVQT